MRNKGGSSSGGCDIGSSGGGSSSGGCEIGSSGGGGSGTSSGGGSGSSSGSGSGSGSGIVVVIECFICMTITFYSITKANVDF